MTERSNQENSGQKKILIIEDNELNLKLFNDLLDAHGYKTVESRDGRKAFEITMRENPDLIIMDIQLPNISGIDVIRQIKSDKKLKHIPIIAVTAYAMQDDEERIMSAGCEGYISKPIEIASFVEKVREHTN